MMKQDKKRQSSIVFFLPLVASGLTILIWFFQSLHWWSILDADSALYSLMSLEILRGHHYLYTAGQVHGGTLLTYARAAVFGLFGPSPFLGFLINGFVLSAAVGFWCRAALELGGVIAAVVTGLLCFASSTIFIQFSCTDYFVVGALAGGIMVCIGIYAARAQTLSTLALFGVGALLGFSFYISRFTLLYTAMGGVTFYGLSSGAARAAVFPSFWEFKRARGMKRWLTFALSAMAALHLMLFFPAFFTDDRFLGVNAEIALKLGFKCLAALWILHRFTLLCTRKFAAFFCGIALGLVPHILFVLSHPEAQDRTTGLVRFQAFAAVLPEFTRRLGGAFSWTRPLSLGLFAAICSILCICLGLLFSSRPQRRQLALLVLGMSAAVASWLLVHTYMYMVTQYFYPAYFPLFLCMGLSVAWIRGKKTKALAAALSASVLIAGGADFIDRMQEPNVRVESGVLEQLQAWNVRAAGAEYWSSYDMMWALTSGDFIIDALRASRFPQFQSLLAQERRIGYVFKAGDIQPIEKRAYHVLKSASLKYGYRAELLERN